MVLMMHPQLCILSVDIGTSATKAVLFAEDLSQIAVVRRHYAVLAPHAGWSEQEPEAIYRAAFDAMAGAINELPPGASIAAIAFSSQLYSVLACSTDGTPLGRSLTWSDTRSARIASEFRHMSQADGIRARTGCPIDAIYPLSKIPWLKRHAAVADDAHFVSIKEYVLFRLTGEWVVDWSVASATGMFDIRARKWDAQALATAGIGEGNLSSLASPRHHDLRLSAAAAGILGVPAATPLVLGGGDGPLASIGVGALQTSALAINVGTSAAARYLVKRPIVDPAGRLWTYVADEDLWVVGGIVSGGGIAYEWALRAFFGGYYDAEANGVAARALAERMASSISPGADGLLFLPYLSGEQCPAWNPETRGSFVGMELRHTPGHFMRAVLEGITRSLWLVGESIETALDARPRSIRPTGGVSTSALWLQIAADIFGMPISVPETAEGSARGAAVIAMLALGLRDAVSDFHILSAAQQVVHPNPAAHEVYRRQYDRFRRVLEFARALEVEVPSNPLGMEADVQ
jgi:gluconokinase